MKQGIILLLLIAFLSGACNFNKLLVSPEKIPHDKKEGGLINYTYKDGKMLDPDTTIVHYGNNFQPAFTDKKGNKKDLGFTVESVIFKNEKGTKLNGWMIKPEGMTPKITLFFMHGNGGNIITHYPTVLPLVKKGFQVFIFDYSGYGFSDGKATRDNVLKDSETALKYLHGRADVKNTPVVVYGQSMGAHFSALVAMRNPELTDGLVVEAGFSTYKAIAAHFITLGFLAHILVKNDYGAAGAVKEYHKPVLVIHSSQDDVVPIAMGRKIFDNANQPKSFYEITQGHMCGPVYFSDSIRDRINLMVNK